MDKSYLSRTEVAVASRDFVCIRLATYESKEEADFLKTIYRGRSGELENTTFAITDPTGTKQLVRAGRGPMHSFRSASDMAQGLEEIAAKYPKRKKPGTDAQLPLMKSVDLALNVASCDSLPVVIAIAKSENELKPIHASLVKHAWTKSLGGQFVYASATKAKQLKPISGLDDDSQIVIVSPDEFGVSGKVLAQFKAGTEADEIAKKMTTIASTFPRKNKSRREHIGLGITLGLDWETEIPSTDEQANRAKERIRSGYKR